MFKIAVFQTIYMWFLLTIKVALYKTQWWLGFQFNGFDTARQKRALLSVATMFYKNKQIFLLTKPRIFANIQEFRLA